MLLSTDELWTGRTGGTADGVRDYSRIWRGLTSDAHDTAATILDDPSAVQEGDPFPDDADAYCTSVIPSQEQFGAKWWTITATYSTDRERASNPLNDPPEIDWDAEQFEETAYDCRKADPADPDNDASVGDPGAALNTAGDPFDPPILRDNSRLVCNIKANIAAIPVEWLNLRDAVNDAPVIVDGVVFEKRQLKVSRPKVSIVKKRNGISYREFRLTAAGDDRTWDEQPPSLGFHQRVEKPPSSGTFVREPIMTEDSDGNKVPVSAPVMLDADGLPIDDPTPDDTYFMRYRKYKEVDLTILPGIEPAP